ncbi:MAG: DUF3040 domain-containing protein [Streptosporangiaceae bacterium]
MSLSVHEREVWQEIERQLATDPDFVSRVTQASGRLDETKSVADSPPAPPAPAAPAASVRPPSPPDRRTQAWGPRPSTPGRAALLVLIVVAGAAGLVVSVGVFLLTAPLAMAAAAFVLWGPRLRGHRGHRGRRFPRWRGRGRH